MTVRIKALQAVLCLVVSLSAETVSASGKTDTIPLDPAVRYGKLENGFTYYICQNEMPADKIELAFIVKAGYFQADSDQAHLPHVLEHAVLGKTRNIPSIMGFLKNKGLAVGTDFNASTGYAMTRYWISADARKHNLLADALFAFREIAANAMLDDATLEAERGIVLNEINHNSDDVYYAIKIVNDPHFYLSGRDIESVRNFKYESLRRFYRDWYRPDLQAISIIGNINVDSVEHLVKERFSDLQMPARPRQWHSYTSPLSPETNTIILDDWHMPNQIYVEILNRDKGFYTQTPENYKKQFKIDLINEMLRQRFSNFEAKNIQPATTMFCQNATPLYSAEIDALTFAAILIPEGNSFSLTNTLAPFINERERLVKYGFTQKEFQAVKKRMARSGFTLQWPENSKEIQARIDNHFLGKDAAPGKKYIDSITVALITNISLAEINSQFKTWLKMPPDIVIRSSKDTKKYLPAQETVPNLMDKIAKSKIAPYISPDETTSLLSKSTTDSLTRQMSVVDKIAMPEIAATKVILKNGAAIIFKPFKPQGVRSDKILITAFRDPNANKPIKDYFNYFIGETPVLNSGVGNFTWKQIEKTLSKSSSTIRPFRTQNAEGVNIEVTGENIELAMQLLYLHLTSSRYNKKTFDVINHYTFVVTGDFNMDTVLTQAGKYIAGMPAGPVRTPVLVDAAAHANGPVLYKTLDSVSTTSNSVKLEFATTSQPDLRTKVELSVLCRVLGNLLFTNIREKMGMAYAIMDPSVVYRSPGNVSIISNFFTSGNAGLVADSSIAVINRLIAEAPSPALTETARRQEITDNQAKTTSNDFWQEYIVEQLATGGNLNEIYQRIDIARTIDAKTIHETARKYLVPKETWLISSSKNPATKNIPVRPAEEINDAAWQIFSTSADNAQLNAALADMTRVLADTINKNNPYFIDTYANLLYKLKFREKAMAAEARALNIVSVKRSVISDLALNLYKMKTGQPTWNKENKYLEDHQAWTNVQSNLSHIASRASDSIIAVAKMKYAREKDSAMYVKKLIEYLSAFKPFASPNDYNNRAYDIYLFSSDPAALKTALAYSQLSLKDSAANPSLFAFYDTYAGILFKLGKKKQAIAAQQQAISLAPKADKAALMQTLERFKGR
ncbi:insulinase family protein [Chitinophaga sp. YIM B06452]|uniref:M16 family metallopeptidase n=1 Tax=Chitinophaga sp. YIM B06452 TaxID=3082158 RepID=UPI0031FF0DE6